MKEQGSFAPFLTDPKCGSKGLFVLKFKLLFYDYKFGL